MTTAARKKLTETVDEPVNIPAINIDDDFVEFIRGEMGESHADISRLTGLKLSRELHYSEAVDRLIAARDAEFAALDDQISRHTRKHDGCSAALQNMGAEPASAPKSDNVVDLDMRNVA